jgi:protein-histidine pros-kinase
MGTPATEAKNALEQAAEELLFAHDLALAMFNESPDAIIVVDAAGRIVIANKMAELMFGYHRSELRGKTVEILVPEDLREVHTAHRVKYMDEPRTRPMGLGLQLRGRHKDGREFSVDINLAPVATSKGQYTLACIRRRRP